MKKLRLELDDLHVEGFVAGGAEPARGGTVRGHLDDASLDATCGESCGAPCDTAYCGADTAADTCGDDELYRRIILY